ncbi:MAG: hypothetical protein G01um101424_36 [Parcubacteria group bacterium Gr01-1014_24]|nr:MAG: hypothetical protein G01um101424_36 [Parcubacteria group bacterium Gr01-1014_24]
MRRALGYLLVGAPSVVVLVYTLMYMQAHAPVQATQGGLITIVVALVFTASAGGTILGIGVGLVWTWWCIIFCIIYRVHPPYHIPPDWSERPMLEKEIKRELKRRVGSLNACRGRVEEVERWEVNSLFGLRDKRSAMRNARRGDRKAYRAVRRAQNIASAFNIFDVPNDLRLLEIAVKQ